MVILGSYLVRTYKITQTDFIHSVDIMLGIGLTPLITLIYISMEPAVTQNCVPLLQTYYAPS